MDDSYGTKTDRPVSLEALLRACADQDTAAFEAVYQLTSPHAWTRVCQAFPSLDKAETVLVSIYTTVWLTAGGPTFTASRSAWSWLLGLIDEAIGKACTS